MAGDGHDGNFTPLRASPVANHVARLGRCAKPRWVSAGPGQQDVIPVIAIDIHQLGRGGVGVLPVHFARQTKAEVVWDQQGMSYLRRLLWLLFDKCVQLIERVERQKLDTAAAVNCLSAELRLGAGHYAVGAPVAVRHRQTDALAVFIKQHIVHAPGINADAIDLNTLLADLV